MPKLSQVSGADEYPGIPRPDVTVAQIVLLVLAEKGSLSFRSIVAHPLVKSLGELKTENSFYTALARLQRRQQVRRTAQRTYELTGAGEYAAVKAYVRKGFTDAERRGLSGGSHQKLPTWDGRWRIVFFDVPESKRAVRDYVRSVLKRLGCREFQRSAWIYPHKLPLFIQNFLSDSQLRRYTRVVTTYDIDYDEDLQKQFKLS